MQSSGAQNRRENHGRLRRVHLRTWKRVKFLRFCPEWDPNQNKSNPTHLCCCVDTHLGCSGGVKCVWVWCSFIKEQPYNLRLLFHFLFLSYCVAWSWHLRTRLDQVVSFSSLLRRGGKKKKERKEVKIDRW